MAKQTRWLAILGLAAGLAAAPVGAAAQHHHGGSHHGSYRSYQGDHHPGGSWRGPNITFGWG
ncbi:MAG: hypothetical protein P8Y71_17195 [Pseudolabrys sp.]